MGQMEQNNKKAMQRRIDAKNLIPSSPALERGWNSLWVSFIYWLMVPSSLLASVMLCDSLRVDNLIWCVVACFLCVRSFFLFCHAHTNLVNDARKEQCVNCFYCACVCFSFRDTLLGFDSIHTNPSLSLFYFFFPVFDFDFVRVTHRTKVCVHTKNGRAHSYSIPHCHDLSTINAIQCVESITFTPI